MAPVTVARKPVLQGVGRVFDVSQTTEREGFEPSKRGRRLQHFQCCLFSLSSTAPWSFILISTVDPGGRFAPVGIVHPIYPFAM